MVKNHAIDKKMTNEELLHECSPQEDLFYIKVTSFLIHML